MLDKEEIKRFFEEIGLAKGIANLKKFEQEIIIPEIIKAEKGVFDDFENELRDRRHSDQLDECIDIYKKLKQRHLSTFPKEKQHNIHKIQDFKKVKLKDLVPRNYNVLTKKEANMDVWVKS